MQVPFWSLHDVSTTHAWDSEKDLKLAFAHKDDNE